MTLSVSWGALWALAMGFWLLAKPLLEFHRLTPRGAVQWLTVEAALAIGFAIMGAFLALYSGLAPGLFESLRGRRLADRTWAFALALPGLLGLAYLADSLLVEWITFGTGQPDPRLVRAALGCLALLPLAAGAYHLVRKRRRRADPRAFALLVGALAVAGGLRLALAGDGEPEGARRPAPALERRPGIEFGAPVLLVGLDSGNWQTLRPLLASGRLPTLERLLSAGASGTVEAAWPPHWSAPAWGAILTGHPREETGVFEDLAVMAPGLAPFEVPLRQDWRLNPLVVLRRMLQNAGVIRVTPPPRSLLRRDPIWERLGSAGVKTAVVRFRFTFPAEGQDGIVVSDWVGRDHWDQLGVYKEASSGLVSPPAMARQLMAPFTAADDGTDALVRQLFPRGEWPKPRDATRDPLQILRLAADIDLRTYEVSRWILAHDPHLPLLAVYIGGFDTVCHAFWQYRFPASYPDHPPADADVRTLGPVVDRYLEFFDRELGRLIASYAVEPNVVLVSDHGHGPIRDHPLWRGWHSDEGILVVSGPDAPAGSIAGPASYLDVAPLVLDLMGFRTPPDLRESLLVRR